MRTLFILSLATVLFSASVHAQTKIELKDAAAHKGDSVTVCGKIFGGIYLDKSGNKPTFLNMGAAYPNQLLTVVIWGDKRKLFSYAPEVKLKNKNVCVSGKVEIYKGKPQIVIKDVKQLQVME